MVPAGAPTEDVIAALAERMKPGDILIDGGNSHYKDDVRRAGQMKAKRYPVPGRGDERRRVGTRAGLLSDDWRQPRMPLHTSIRSFERSHQGAAALPGRPGVSRSTGTAEEGYLHCGPAGAGHFVKMVHNGIEYGLMQALAEGFDILRGARIEGLEDSLATRGHRRSVASWKRPRVLAARSHGERLDRGPGRYATTVASSKTRARDAGRLWLLWKRPSLRT